MNLEQITKMVNDVFSVSFEIAPERLKSEAKVFEELGLDSLDVVDLVVALQKKFKVQIRDDDRVRQIRTLGDIYQFILTLENEGHVPA